MHLNERAWQLCCDIEPMADLWRVMRHRLPSGALCWDFGNQAAGGLSAGLHLARICLADLATVSLVPCEDLPGAGVGVLVTTDHPFHACMASQYAGWKIQSGDYFAMGSGPMRAAAAAEAILGGFRETTDCAVGVLEAGKLPPDVVARDIAVKCHIDPSRLCLLLARTASQAGQIQVVARSVETTLHKLHDLGYPLERIRSAAGVAPLPPVAKNDMQGIGRTNDAILYGARVTLWTSGTDDEIAAIIDKIPSCSSSDFGRPFGEIFAQYDYDFYRVDPQLFSPASVRMMNIDSGRTFQAGSVRTDILSQSFYA